MTVTRTIKTRLAVEGEAEYQSKMQQCAAAIRETSSVLDLVTAKYAENADSMEALTAKSDVLQRMYDQQCDKVKLATSALENARKAQEDHARAVMETRDKLADAEQKMQEYAETGQTTGEAYDALNREIEELRKQLSESEAMYDAASRGVNKWQIEVNKAETAMVKTGDALRKNNDALSEIVDVAQQAGDATEEMGGSFDLSALSIGAMLDKVKNIDPAVGVATTTVIAAGKAVYELAEQYQDAASVIGKATGAIGDDLYALTDIAYQATGNVDATLDEVAAAVGEINTRYGLLGEELQEITQQFADFADVNNTDVVGAVQNVSKIMRNYGVDTQDTGRLLDMLTVAAQKSGIAFASLSSQLINGKAQFLEFGFTLEESIALISLCELEGLNLNSMLMGFRAAATTAAKAGKDLPRMLDDTIDAIKDAKTEQEALNIATEAFGTRAAQEMLLAIRSGRLDMEDWVEALENSQGAMMASAEATDTFADKWQQAKNSILADLNDLKKEFQDLSGASADALTESEESFAAAVEGYDKQRTQIDASAVVVERYALRLQELEEQGLSNNEQQAEYNKLIAQINTLMPELNLQINEQTGLLEGGTEALLSNIDAWKQYAEQHAQAQFEAETQKAYTDALAEEMALRNQRAVLVQKEAEAQARYDAEYQKYAEELAKINEEAKKNGNNARAYASRIQQIEGALRPYRKELSDVQDEIGNVDKALETNAETIDEASRAVDALSESYGDLNNGLGDTSGLNAAEDELSSYATALSETSEAGIAALQALQAEYDEAYAAAYVSIDAQIGKWTEFSAVTEKEAAAAVDGINKALDSQIEFLENYTDNFRSLMDRDIDGIDILAEKLSDGSEESAAILEGLTDKTDEEIKAIIDKLRGVEEGKEEFANEIAMMETDYKARMDEIERDTGLTIDAIILEMDASEQAYTAGLATGEGFNQGLRQMLEEARSIAAEYNGIFAGMQDKLEGASSSGNTAKNSHANGLYSVPYDEYPAILHKGERVLTAAEARLYNEREKWETTDNSRTINMGGITINGDADRKTVRMIERAIRKAVR